jgi:hypothetical protein
MCISAYSSSFSNHNHETVLLKVVLYVYRLPRHPKWMCWKSVSMSGLSKPDDMFIRCSKRTWSRLLLWGLLQVKHVLGKRVQTIKSSLHGHWCRHDIDTPTSVSFLQRTPFKLLLEPLHHLDFWLLCPTRISDPLPLSLGGQTPAIHMVIGLGSEEDSSTPSVHLEQHVLYSAATWGWVMSCSTLTLLVNMPRCLLLVVVWRSRRVSQQLCIDGWQPSAWRMWITTCWSCLSRFCFWNPGILLCHSAHICYNTPNVLHVSWSPAFVSCVQPCDHLWLAVFTKRIANGFRFISPHNFRFTCLG